jgi:CRISPR-associated protein (TIGR03984 family)
MSASLHVYTKTGLSFAAALAALDSLLPEGGEAVALLYAHAWCQFGRRRGRGPWLGPAGEAITSPPVYEARVFNEDVELRWLNDPSGAGGHRAVLLSEKDLPPPGWSQTPVEPPVVGRLDQQFLCWGQQTESLADGWQRLTTARVGKLDVPLAGGLEKGQRVVLKYVEYLGEFAHGNYGVVAERLVKLEPHPK